MGQANLHAAQHGRHAGAVRWQVAEVGGDDGRGRHGRLQHPHERVAVQGLDELDLRGAGRGGSDALGGVAVQAAGGRGRGMWA